MKGDAIMTERFENRFNMSNSNAACTEFRSASSSCTKTTKSENTALLLTMDTALAVSIFAALCLILARLVSSAIIIIDAAAVIIITVVLFAIIICICGGKSRRLNVVLVQ